jgi:hypothetical protein
MRQAQMTRLVLVIAALLLAACVIFALAER